MIDGDAIGPLSYALAFGGGLISFLSPCVLPIVPGYVSLITGLDLVEFGESRSSSNAFPVLRDTSLFVLGFGTVFILLGVSATAVGQTVFDHQEPLTRASGALVLAMALLMIGSMYLQAP